MADAEDQHYEPVVFEGANYSVISNAVFPQSAQSALKTCSDLSWMVQSCDALAEKL